MLLLSTEARLPDSLQTVRGLDYWPGEIHQHLNFKYAGQIPTAVLSWYTCRSGGSIVGIGFHEFAMSVHALLLAL
jgi:hypothetical protein